MDEVPTPNWDEWLPQLATDDHLNVIFLARLACNIEPREHFTPRWRTVSDAAAIAIKDGALRGIMTQGTRSRRITEPVGPIRSGKMPEMRTIGVIQEPTESFTTRPSDFLAWYRAWAAKHDGYTVPEEWAEVGKTNRREAARRASTAKSMKATDRNERLCAEVEKRMQSNTKLFPTAACEAVAKKHGRKSGRALYNYGKAKGKW